MARCIVYDFDGTLTRTDTVKLLVQAFFCRYPLRSACALVHAAVVFLRGSGINSAKDRFMRSALSGLTDRQADSVARRYARLVEKVLRPDMWQGCMTAATQGDTVVIATASSAFAVRKVFEGLPVVVIGSEYETDGGVYTGKSAGPACFGAAKAQMVQAWMRSSGVSQIDDAISDSESDRPLLNMAVSGGRLV